MASVDRVTLPDGQWADVYRRPSHGQMKEIERLTRKAMDANLALEGEDAMVLTLVQSWSVRDVAGADVPLRREALDRVPQDTMSALIEELLAIVETTRPNDAIGRLMMSLRALEPRLPAEDQTTMREGIDLVAKALGVADPNPQDQAG